MDQSPDGASCGCFIEPADLNEVMASD